MIELKDDGILFSAVHTGIHPEIVKNISANIFMVGSIMRLNAGKVGFFIFLVPSFGIFLTTLLRIARSLTFWLRNIPSFAPSLFLFWVLKRHRYFIPFLRHPSNGGGGRARSPGMPAYETSATPVTAISGATGRYLPAV